MNALTEQTFFNEQGDVVGVYLPYNRYCELIGRDEKNLFPNEVVGFWLEYENLLKAWRMHRQMSQSELAYKSGIKQASISRMEKQGVKLTKPSIIKLAKALGIYPEQLKL